MKVNVVILEISGVTEHFGVPIEDVDMIMSSLENAIASTGGFCVGRSYIVAHQRLSGQGYCFSASLPPLLATAASEALHIIEEQPERIAKTQQLSCLAHTLLQKVLDGTGFVLRGVEQSPMKHIGYDGDKQLAETKLDALVDYMFDDHSILLTRARYLDSEEAFSVAPSIRFMVQYAMTEEELQKTTEAIGIVVNEKL
ncbi:unnamed protein product [Auanema sp. JU1783]|nr:unnamed protein product [Auanema sp. JU1783]